MEWRTRSQLGYLGLTLGIFVAALDQTVVVTALPSIIVDLEIPFTELNRAAWIVTGYLLGYTVAMPLFGRVSDVFGRRRTYVLCCLIFIVGSVLCGLARDLYWLVAARMLQAIGGGAIIPVALGIAGDEFAGAKRNVAIGAIGAVAEAGGVLGPLYGAVIVERLAWQWIFYLNVPLGLVALGGAFLFAKSDRPAGGKIDFLGALLVGASLGALTLGLSVDVGPNAAVWPRVVLLLAALGLLALFLLRQARVREPLFDPALFKRLGFASGNVTSFLVGIALITAMVDVPLFAATILQRSPLDGGLMLMRMTVAMPIGALAGGMLTARMGARTTSALGLLLSGGGLYLIGRWTGELDEATLTRDLALAGLGFGLVIAPITGTVLGAVSAAQSGIAAAVVTVMRMVGMMVGLSALTAWGLGRFNTMMAGLPLPLPVPGEPEVVSQQRMQAYQNALHSATLSIFHEVFTAAAIVCFAALLVTALFVQRATRNSPASRARVPR